MLRFLVGFALPCLLTSVVAAEDWPQWLGPNRDNHANIVLQPWQGPLAVAWRVPVGEGHGGPIVADGKVFLHYKPRTEEKEEVLCLELNSGKELWRQSYERTRFTNQFGNGPRSTPLYHQGTLYTLGVTGLLTAWNANNGQRLWQVDLLNHFKAKNLFFGIATSPLILDQQLIVMVGGSGCCLIALDPNTGAILKQTGDDAASYSSPMVCRFGPKASQLVLLTAAGVRGFETPALTSPWFVPFKDQLNESSSTPIWFQDRLIVSSVTAGMLAIDYAKAAGPPTAEPKVSWKNPALSCYFGTPVGFANHLYVVTGSLPPFASANLHCVDPQTGKVQWTQKKVGTYHATLLATQKHLLLLEEEGALVLVQPDPKEYRELCRSNVCRHTWAHPALADGYLLVRDEQELLAVRLPTGSR